jgi:HAD superfamily hydrolase (TIGR01509 family)
VTPRPGFRAALFDFGDTLFYRRGGHLAVVAAARQLGVEVSDADAKRQWDAVQAAARTPEELAKGRDLSPGRHREAWTALYQAADRIAPGMAELLYEREIDPGSWVPFPDAQPVLESLRAAGIPIGVVSDTGFDIRPIFEQAGWLDWIDTFVLSFEHGVAKPAPELFLAACRDLRVAPSAALMVGDNPLTDGGSVGAGVAALVLPPVAPGAARGLWAVSQLVGGPMPAPPP